MADATFTDEATARAAVQQAFSGTSLEMTYAALADEVLAETLRCYAYTNHAFDIVWRIDDEWPLYWAEIERPLEGGFGEIQDWAMKRDPNVSDQIAILWEQGSRDARIALLTQDKETATLFKMFFG